MGIARARREARKFSVIADIWSNRLVPHSSGFWMRCIAIKARRVEDLIAMYIDVQDLDTPTMVRLE